MSPVYAIEQIRAVLAMAFNRPGWQDSLDLSADGVFRSFTALPVCLLVSLVAYTGFHPFLMAVVTSINPEASVAIPPLFIGLMETAMTLVVSWILTVVMLVRFGHRLAGKSSATPIIVGFNWLQLPLRLLMLLPFILLSVTGSQMVLEMTLLPSVAISGYMFFGVLRRIMPVPSGLVLMGMIAAVIFVSAITGQIIASIGLLFYDP